METNGTTALVTGATGFIGQTLTRRLLAALPFSSTRSGLRQLSFTPLASFELSSTPLAPWTSACAAASTACP